MKLVFWFLFCRHFLCRNCEGTWQSVRREPRRFGDIKLQKRGYITIFTKGQWRLIWSFQIKMWRFQKKKLNLLKTLDVDLKDNVKVGAGLIKVCVLGGGGDPGDLLTWSLHTLHITMSEKYMSIGAPMTELPLAQPRGHTSHSHRWQSINIKCFFVFQMFLAPSRAHGVT